MSRQNEHTPLLVTSSAPSLSPLQRHRPVWQLLLAGALSLGILSSFHEQPSDNLVAAVSLQAPTTAASAAIDANLAAFEDPSVDPCTDFYQYACGGWIKTHEIPPGESSIDSSFSVVAQATAATLQDILDSQPPQIGPFLASCGRIGDVDPAAMTVVQQLVHTIQETTSARALLALAGRLKQSFDISTFFSLAVLPDPHDPSVNVLHVSQGGFTMPAREDYLDPSRPQGTITALYEAYATKMFAQGGIEAPADLHVFVANVLATETVFANASVSIAEINNPLTTNTAYSFSEIAQRYPFLLAYVNGMDAQARFPMTHAIVKAPKFFEAQTHLLNDASKLPEVKNYFIFRLLDSLSSLLGDNLRQASSDFHDAFRGTSSFLPRDRFCAQVTMSYLSDEVGHYYLNKVLSPAAKTAAEAQVQEIEAAMRNLLRTESWLDKSTYDAAVQKLELVRNFIGGPDHVRELPFQLKDDAFFENARQILNYRATTMLQSIGKPVDLQAWDISTFTVDAYYDMNENKMVFPAAILQPPFYSGDNMPAAANFGRIGMVMGHELTHGFDNEGRNFDGHGVLRSWWTPHVATEFTTKADCLVAQYATFPIVSSVDGHVLGTVDGNLTLRENIADNGGIRLAYEAYQMWKRSTRTPSPPARKLAPRAEDDRVFFTAFAHNFCQKHTPQLADYLRQTDMHSPGKWRVNGPLMNYDKFADVFACPVGSPMNPEQKCRVW
ncbi:hypothetical protein PsorP6_006455 [Peronosclerospora sorghi]|uniref:Uncharacterized protein n=1 Tax=Peronosclerospora sorghi TaxID=230839 RepID=A0ACC0W4X8_9STRA|nr:hypothetical protein PsorP6_006455 [Peronosclerospora sorghi]